MAEHPLNAPLRTEMEPAAQELFRGSSGLLGSPETRGALSGFGTIGPEWLKRALDPAAPILNNQTVQTASRNLDGRELLFPMLRLQPNGELAKFETEDEAFAEALRLGDFIEFSTPDQATAFSKELSDEIGRRRQGAQNGTAQRQS